MIVSVVIGVHGHDQEIIYFGIYRVTGPSMIFKLIIAIVGLDPGDVAAGGGADVKHGYYGACLRG